jgi:hypothetical protein
MARRQLIRIVLITDPPGEHEITITNPELREVSLAWLPACVVTRVEFYDQDGVCFMQTEYPLEIPAGGTLTIPLYVSVW